MVSFAETIGLTTISTVLPLLSGLVLGYFLRGKDRPARLPILATIAAGMIAWFFLDVMADAAFLGINEGFSGGVNQLLLIVLFPVGLMTMIGLDTRAKPASKPGIAYIVALAIGLHGIAEGVAIGSGLEPAPDFLSLGGVEAAVSFVVHKVLEGFAISVFINPQRPYAKIFNAMLVAGVPTILGSAVGFGFALDSSFFFALGGGAAIWLLATLLQRSSSVADRRVWAAFLLSGVLSMYAAGLIHTG